MSDFLPPTIFSTTTTVAAPIITSTMEPSVEDLSDDLDNLSFTSTTTAAETRHSTSSGSETTWTTSTSSLASNSCKPHHPPQCDECWHAIKRGKCDSSSLTLADLRFVHKLGSGDIGSVYLVVLREGNGCLFAAKVMDKKEMAAGNKESRARIERGILEMLEHPFLPTLHATLDSPRWSCLLTEFCPGGDLHVLRQQQPDKRFDEAVVRFYASEVVAALEYLHMMGIIYRDLKPENVLIISDQNRPPATSSPYPSDTSQFATSSCILPNCIVPAVSCLQPRRKRKKKLNQRGTLEIVAEPVDVRSMSFVGTHEYLAPEIVSGEGHGSAVDWWTLGVFIFEMFYGVTPFKGMDHELTLANVVARALEFPKEPSIPVCAKDLITQLLVKDPARRLGSTMGATAVKHHQFFEEINWALLRCKTPPYVPQPFTYKNFIATNNGNNFIEHY
ncbi:PROTEIN KINASE G11A-LIKE [Salix viminalis]|uniref:non-specific serine/threonine protein kinase n=1 Tax=Salix viminalis TaxID=40686 RepID=A0A9Q0Z3N3_SALVM|nr:PROTEIN KINASE G11A-LIKE [Salix viminalis]